VGTSTAGVGDKVGLGAWNRGALKGLDTAGVRGTEVTTIFVGTVILRASELDSEGNCLGTVLSDTALSTWGAGDFGRTGIALATFSTCSAGDFGGTGVALVTSSAWGADDFGGPEIGIAALATCAAGDLEGAGIALLTSDELRVSAAVLSTDGDLEVTGVALSIFSFELETCSLHKAGTTLFGVGATIGPDSVLILVFGFAGRAPFAPSVATGWDLWGGAYVHASGLITEYCSGFFRTPGVFSKELDDNDEDATSAAAFFSKWALSSFRPSISFSCKRCPSFW
jgi:hypothetical protein